MGSVKKPQARDPQREDTDDDEAEIEHVGQPIGDTKTDSIQEFKGQTIPIDESLNVNEENN